MEPIERIVHAIPETPEELYKLPEDDQFILDNLSVSEHTTSIEFEHMGVGWDVHTKKISNCNSVVLYGKNKTGISHYGKSSDLYLPILEKKMQHDILGASIVGGSEKHFILILEQLRSMKIPLIAGFCDGWKDGDLKPTEVYRKEIIGLGDTKETYVNFYLHNNTQTGYYAIPKIKTSLRQE